MGYFANGTEGMSYEEKYCSRCVHFQRDDNDPSCPVWLAHLLYAYDECNNDGNAARMLGMLIPRSKDGIGNAQCAMYHERPGAVDRRQLPLFDAKARTV